MVPLVVFAKVFGTHSVFCRFDVSFYIPKALRRVLPETLTSYVMKNAFGPLVV